MRSTRTNGKSGVPLSLQFIADREQRIIKQKQLIAELKRRGRPTEQAEVELREHLLALATLRNHSEIALELTTVDRCEMRLGEKTGPRGTPARNQAE